MGKKERSSEGMEVDEGGEGSPAKKSKIKDFSEIDFKVMLKDPNTSFTALERFIEAAEAYPVKTAIDIVANYTRTSGECNEIFNLLEGGKRKTSELCLIFDTLEHVLIRVVDDLQKQKGVAAIIVRRILAAHLSAIYTTLSMKNNARQIKSGLKLLTAMVTVSETCARDIATQFDFTHANLKALLQRRDTKDPQDIRTCLLQFLMAFLIVGENSVIRQIVEFEGVIHQIFTGMPQDKLSTLQMVLPTLLEKVVQNPGVNKTLKVRFFGPHLRALASLYKWKGPSKWNYGKGGKGKTAEVEEESQDAEVDAEFLEEKLVVQGLVHELLLELCCSTKTGINFYDKTLGTSGKNENHMLSDLLKSLTQTWQHGDMSELVVRILQVCPDQLHIYLHCLNYSLTPRPSHNWVNAMKLLSKIYEEQTVMSPVWRRKDRLPLPKLVKMLMVSVVLPEQYLPQLNQAIMHKSVVVQHSALAFMQQQLKRVARVNQCIAGYAGWSEEAVYSASELQEITQLFREGTAKALPELRKVLDCWNSSCHPSKPGAEPAEASDTADKPAQPAEQADLPKIKRLDHLVEILQVLCAYQEAFPAIMEHASVDYGALLDGVMSVSQAEGGDIEEEEDEKNKEKRSILQLHMLKLLANAGSGQLALTKVVGGRSTLHLLLGMPFSSPTPELRKITIHFITQLLTNTGVFLGHQGELLVWLEHLAQFSASGSQGQQQQQHLLAFLDKALVNLLVNPHSHTDRVMDVVAEAMMLETSTTGDDKEDTASIMTLDGGIDAIISLEEVDLTMEQPVAEEGVASSSEENPFPFSPLVPAALSALKKLPPGEEKTTVVCEYLGCVFNSILNMQLNPVPLCLLIKQNKECLQDDSIHKYSSLWLPDKQQKTSSTPKKQKVEKVLNRSTTASSLLQACFTAGASMLQDEKVLQRLAEDLKEMGKESMQVLVKQILLYLSTDVSRVEKKIITEVVPIQAHFDLLQMMLKICCEKGHEERTNSAVAAKETEPEEDMDVDEDVDDEKEEEEKERSHTDLPHEQKTDFSNLMVQSSSWDQIFADLCKMIFQNPALAKWFLYAPSVVENIKISKTVVQELREAVSTNIAKLLLIVRSIDVDVSSYIGSYQRVLLIQAETGCYTNDVLHSVTAMLPLLPIDTQATVTEHLLLMPLENMAQKTTLTELGKAIIAAVHCVLESQQKSSVWKTLPFNQKAVGSLFALSLATHSEGVEKLLLVVVTAFPSSVLSVNKEVFEYLLQVKTESGRGILEVLLRQSLAARQWLAEWCERASCDEIKEELPLLVVKQYLSLQTTTGKGDKSTRFLGAVKKLHDVYFADLFEWITSPEQGKLEDDKAEDKLAVFIYLEKMLPEGTEKLESLWRDLHSIVQAGNPLSCQQVALYRTQIEEPSSECQENFVADSLKSLIMCLSNKASRNPALESVFIQNTLEHITKLDSKQFVREQISTQWNNLVRYSLRYYYDKPDMLQLLCHLVGVIYESEETNEERKEEDQPQALKLTTLHQMLLSHSLFLPIIMDKESKYTQVKEYLVDVLLRIVGIEPSCCQASHVAIFLGAYGASLSMTDQKLLCLMMKYEKSGVDMSDNKPYMWGPKAVEYHSVKKNLGPSLRKRPSMEQVLELLDKDLLFKSCLNFPLLRTFQLDELKDSDLYKSKSDCYDPSFLLPLLSHLLAPESLVHCLKFVEYNCLGFLFCALSSHDSSVRGAAYHCLLAFSQHLEGSKFADRTQVAYLIECVKNSLDKPNTKLASIITVFLAKIIPIIIKPDDALYQQIYSFILVKPSIDILNIPEFYKLFNSSHIEYKLERSWILQLTRDGLRETADYRIFEKRYTFKILLSFHDSAISDTHTQLLVLKILAEACSIKTVAADLTKNHGIVSWICSAIKTSINNKQKMLLLNEIVSKLWYAMLGEREGSGEVRCLPILFTNHILMDTLLLTTAIGDKGNMAVFHQHVDMLLSMLGHLDRTRSEFEANNYCATTTQLTTSNVSTLLHSWAQVSRDLRLTEKLTTELSQCTQSPIKGAVAPPSKEVAIEEDKGILKSKKDTTAVVDIPDNDITKECVLGILDTLQYWRPSLEDSPIDGADIKTFMFVFHWSLEQTILLSLDPKHLLGLLTNTRKMLSSKGSSSQKLAKSLWQDSPIAGDITAMLLKIYEKHVWEGDQVETLPSVVTDILLSLVDQGLKLCALPPSMQSLVEGENYKYGLKEVLLKKETSDPSTESTSLLLRELWLRADPPRHYQQVTLQTQPSKQQTPAKTKATPAPDDLPVSSCDTPVGKSKSKKKRTPKGKSTPVSSAMEVEMLESNDTPSRMSKRGLSVKAQASIENEPSSNKKMRKRSVAGTPLSEKKKRKMEV